MSEKKEKVRLQKVIADAGFSSRRGAEKLIEEGLVKLNGKVVSELGTKMQLGVDELEVQGELINTKKPKKRLVYALYKPKNCITSLHDPEGRPTIKRFFPKTEARLFPIGRLDYDTEGLILLTNDGDFAQAIAHPKFHLWKSYFVKIKGIIQEKELRQLREGVRVRGIYYRPARFKILHCIRDKTWLEVSLQEGRNRQIKKTFQHLGYFVLKIKRFRIGSITLEELTPGQSRRLSEAEINQLLNKEGRRPSRKHKTLGRQEGKRQ